MFVLEFIYNLLFLIESCAFSAILFLVSWKERGSHPYRYLSSLFSGLTWLFVGIVVFAFTIVPYPYIGYASWWSGAWLLICYMHYAKVKKEMEPSPAGENAGTNGHDKSGNDGLEKKNEWARKAFHLAGFLVIASYFLVSPLVAPLIKLAVNTSGTAYTSIWGPIEHFYDFATVNEAAIYLTLFALMATSILVSLVDMTRIVFGEEYSLIKLIEGRFGKILRDKERGIPGAEIFIAYSSTAAWIISIFFYPLVPGAMFIGIACIMISTLADGVAAIVGKSIGKRALERPFDQIKTVEGLIAGAVTSFLIGVIFMEWYLALIAAGIFVVIDYLSPPVSDNIINPIILTVAINLISLLT